MPPRKPRDDEIEFYALTHPGNVRKSNQDNFLVASLRRRLEVLSTSLPDSEVPSEDERAAFLAMVADGVGGTDNGEEASRVALEEATQYLAQCTDCYYHGDAASDR